MSTPYPPQLVAWARDSSHRRNCNDPDCVKGYAKNRNCGDELTIWLKFDHENRISQSGFDGEGCALALASSSAICSFINGSSKKEAKDMLIEFRSFIETESVVDGTKFSPFEPIKQIKQRHRCVTLITEALFDALV